MKVVKLFLMNNIKYKINSNFKLALIYLKQIKIYLFQKI